MKNILLENMQRFGTKNLSESDIKKLKPINEDEILGSNEQKVGGVDAVSGNVILYNVEVDPDQRGMGTRITPVNKTINVPFKVYIYRGGETFTVDTFELQNGDDQTFRNSVIQVNQKFDVGSRIHKLSIPAVPPIPNLLTPRYSSEATPKDDGSYSLVFKDPRDAPDLGSVWLVKGKILGKLLSVEEYEQRVKSHPSYAKDPAKYEKMIANWKAKYPNGQQTVTNWQTKVRVSNSNFKPIDKRSQQRG